MTIELNNSMTKEELINDAIAFTKYASDDFTALEYINTVLCELKYLMSVGEFKVFTERVNKLIAKFKNS